MKHHVILSNLYNKKFFLPGGKFGGFLVCCITNVTKKIKNKTTASHILNSFMDINESVTKLD